MTTGSTTGGTGPRVLVVATKCPWPPIDGGRLVLAETLRALAQAGARITLVSPPPVDPVARAGARSTWTEPPPERPPEIEHIQVPRPTPRWMTTTLRAWQPATIVRHSNPRAIATVERLVGERTFDVAHAEQLHALPMLEPARARGIPIVLRAQNVESDLWAGAARLLPYAAPWLLLQAALLRRWEGRAVGRVAGTVALTAQGAGRLRALARGRGRVAHVAAPFPVTLPAGERLAGSPAIVLAAGGWIPNRDGARWYVRQVWPLVLARLPAAILHLFDGGADALPRGAVAHPAPLESKDLFPDGAIHVVPLRLASGVRMKILEAWSRGVPVIATAAATAGLENADTATLLGATPAEIALTTETLAHDPDLRQTLVSEGRRTLAQHHDPAAIAARWLQLYRDAGR